MQSVPRVAVIGGGISGLATAAFLRRPGPSPAPDVTLVEADERLGGKVFTQLLDGLPVDTGPDAILTRVPAMAELLTDLGLDGAVVAPAPSGAYIWSRDRLRRLPAGTFFGVPDRLVPMLRSRLLSPVGVARAGLDLVLPRRPLAEDPTVAELLRPRFGRQVVDRLVEPLLGGVYAGATDRLSASSTVPEIESLVRGNRSVYLTLRRRRKAAPAAGGSPLVTFDGGLDRLIRALGASLSGCDVRTGTKVTAVERAGAGFRLTLDGPGGSQVIEADAVVFATPAFVTADLLASLAEQAVTALRAIPYVDVATVNLAYPRDAFPTELDATGFLVPPCEGRLLVGCTWLSTKWAHLAGGPSVLIRGMVGRSGDHRFAALDDDALVEQVHHELVAAMGVTARPTKSLVQRWPRAIPQYTVGHGERLAQVEQALAEVPGLYVAGAAYRGAGVASCVAQAQRTATAVRAGFASLAQMTGGRRDD